MSKITFTKVRDVKTPSRAYEFGAGIDFYIPEYNNTFYKDLIDKNDKGHFDLSVTPCLDGMTITIVPGGRVNIPSGIKVEIEDRNTCLLAANKSGVASKKGLVYGAELVDADYHGEIHLNLINTSNYPVSIKTGDKIMQFMHLPIIYSTLEEVSNTDFETMVIPTARGDKGFGSSGS